MKYEIVFEVIRVVDASCYEDAIGKCFPSGEVEGFLRVKDVMELR